MPSISITSGPENATIDLPMQTHPFAGEKAAAPDSSIADEKGLDEACKEFESLFIYHLLKEMRASIPKDGYLGKSMQSETYTSMFDIEIARELSGQRGIGLADFLMRQLANRLNETESQKTKKRLIFIKVFSYSADNVIRGR